MDDMLNPMNPISPLNPIWHNNHDTSTAAEQPQPQITAKYPNAGKVVCGLAVIVILVYFWMEWRDTKGY